VHSEVVHKDAYIISLFEEELELVEKSEEDLLVDSSWHSVLVSDAVLSGDGNDRSHGGRSDTVFLEGLVLVLLGVRPGCRLERHEVGFIKVDYDEATINQFNNLIDSLQLVYFDVLLPLLSQVVLVDTPLEFDSFGLVYLEQKVVADSDLRELAVEEDTSLLERKGFPLSKCLLRGQESNLLLVEFGSRTFLARYFSFDKDTSLIFRESDGVADLLEAENEEVGFGVGIRGAKSEKTGNLLKREARGFWGRCLGPG